MNELYYLILNSSSTITLKSGDGVYVDATVTHECGGVEEFRAITPNKLVEKLEQIIG